MKLKPCPFCGSKSVEYYWEEDYEGCYLSCDICDSQGPYGDDEKEAIELWNNGNDNLAELVAWYFECSDYYWHDDFLWQHGAPSVQGCAYDELTESYKAAEAALRKAVEEK
jgi:Lar family restriction alleviation protein